jgi:ATP-binding cassette subfamily B protein
VRVDPPKGAVRRRTFELLRPHRRLIALAAVGIVGSTLITVAVPLLVRYAIDHGIEDRDEGALTRVALVFLGLIALRPVLERIVVVTTARAGERFLGALRVAAFRQLQRLSMPFFESERAGVLVSRLTADVQTLTTFTRQVLVEVVGSVLLLLITMVVLLTMSPLLALVALVSAPLLAISAISYQRRSHPSYLALRERVADTMTSLQEGLTGMRVVQSFSREQEQFEGYRRRSSALVRAWRRVSLVNISFFSVISFAQGLSLAAVLFFGGFLYRRGDVSAGTVVAFALYMLHLFDPIARLGDWFSEFQSGRAALTKIVTLLEAPVTVREGRRELPETGDLLAERVTFAYDGTSVLHDVTLSVRAGEHLALVGPTGAGKSTLAKLLTRQYDPGEGVVRFGGLDLREATNASLRRRIVFLPQEGHLFSGSIADNVRLADEGASDEDVERALRSIGAYERFAALPDGLSTDVRTRGVRLSSGERQLVGLARVALADPAVIVLDEATSSLDPATEADVERALAAVSRGRTVITIAHRLSTAERADRVAVVEAGRIVEIATHDELVAEGARYAELWASWEAGQAA